VIGHSIQLIKDLENKPALLSSPAFFTAYERSYCLKKRDILSSFSGIICAKNAFIKAIYRVSQVPNISFSSLEICHSSNGRPKIVFNNFLRGWGQISNVAVDVSISHSGGLSAAMVLLDLRA
jgi:phosphopantetheine--protein transferase-like protein